MSLGCVWSIHLVKSPDVCCLDDFFADFYHFYSSCQRLNRSSVLAMDTRSPQVVYSVQLVPGALPLVQKTRFQCCPHLHGEPIGLFLHFAPRCWCTSATMKSLSHTVQRRPPLGFALDPVALFRGQRDGTQRTNTQCGNKQNGTRLISGARYLPHCLTSDNGRDKRESGTRTTFCGQLAQILFIFYFHPVNLTHNPLSRTAVYLSI